MKLQILALTAALALAGALPAAAQNLEQRQQHQEQRIDQGVRSGALTRHEARRIEVRRHRIAMQEHRMRAAQGGRLTIAQRHRLNRELNHNSRQIARLKHNDRVS